MGTKFWVKRTLTVFLSVLVILFAVELIKGHSASTAAGFAAIWAGISSAIFIATRVFYSRKGVACELCNDTPENNKPR